MRLLVLTELFLPTKGGTAVWAAEVYRRLGGKEIHILTADVPGASAVDAGHPNSIHRLKLGRVPWLRPESLLMYWRLFVLSLKLSLGRRFDGIHAFRALPEGMVAWSVGKLTLRPVTIYVHGEELTTWGRGKKYKAMSFALRHADRVIANSEYTCEALIRMGVKPGRISVIYPGVDTCRFRPGLACDDLKQRLGLRDGEKLIVSVGRLSRRKGFDRVILVLPGLLSRGIKVRYAIIGIGTDEHYLRELAVRTGVESYVHLLGNVTMEDLPRWYNAADVFAMPNREIDGDTEGFGMVFIEAAACGTPVLAGIAGGTAAAVVHDVNGYRVDGSSNKEILDHLELLLRDSETAEKFGRSGCMLVQQRYSWEIVAEKTRAVAGGSIANGEE